MASLYTKLVSGLLFPLHERLKHHHTVAVGRGERAVGGDPHPAQRQPAVEVIGLR